MKFIIVFAISMLGIIGAQAEAEPQILGNHLIAKRGIFGTSCKDWKLLGIRCHRPHGAPGHSRLRNRHHHHHHHHSRTGKAGRRQSGARHRGHTHRGGVRGRGGGRRGGRRGGGRGHGGGRRG